MLKADRYKLPPAGVYYMIRMRIIAINDLAGSACLGVKEASKDEIYRVRFLIFYR
jgi:hypothetical protein